MADIYLAKAFGFGGADQIVAIKSIRPEVLEDPEFVGMFVEEAKLCAMLDHQNIARTYELKRSGTGYFIAMEYVAGKDLRVISDRVSTRNLEFPIHLALHIIAQVCEGLDYAHHKTDPTGVSLDIVHQDVSPQNVLISYNGDVKLIDFGVARAASHQINSRAGVVKGKYGYMSPEQSSGVRLDGRSDVFAAGVLLYELLTHRRLFDGASDTSILEKVKHAEVYPPSLIAPRIPRPVEEVVLKALSHAPQDRYQTAAAMGDAVVKVLLSSFGQPSSRELNNLMKSLFNEEIQQELLLIESTQRIVEMPVDAAELIPGRRATGTFSLSPKDAEHLPIPAVPPQHRRQSVPAKAMVIIGLAVLISVGLVVSTWWHTRSSRSTGVVTVTSDPTSAKVFLDGREVGLTPFSQSGIIVGEHVLEVKLDTFLPARRRIRVQSDKILDVEVRLKSQE